MMKRSCIYFLGFLGAITFAVYAKFSESNPFESPASDYLPEAILDETESDTLAGKNLTEVTVVYPIKNENP
jgi:hypothetical protein